VPWEAVSQQNNLIRLKSNILTPKMFCPPQVFGRPTLVVNILKFGKAAGCGKIRGKILKSSNRGVVCLAWTVHRFKICSLAQLRFQTRRLGGTQRGCQKVFTCLNTPASLRQSLGITQKLLPFLGQENGYFCWLNHAIFQGITTV